MFSGPFPGIASLMHHIYFHIIVKHTSHLPMILLIVIQHYYPVSYNSRHIGLYRIVDFYGLRNNEEYIVTTIIFVSITIYIGSVPKSVQGLHQLRTHISGALVHTRCPSGKLAYAYIDMLQFPHDSNMTIHVLLSVLKENVCRMTYTTHIKPSALQYCKRE